MVIDQNLKLTSELFLLLCIWLPRAERWHVLNEHNAHLVTGLIEQVRFDFDLSGRMQLASWLVIWIVIAYMFSEHVETETLQGFQIKYHRLSVWRGV